MQIIDAAFEPERPAIVPAQAQFLRELLHVLSLAAVEIAVGDSREIGVEPGEHRGSDVGGVGGGVEGEVEEHPRSVLARRQRAVAIGGLRGDADPVARLPVDRAAEPVHVAVLEAGEIMLARAALRALERRVAVRQHETGQAVDRRRIIAEVGHFLAVAGNEDVDPARSVAVARIVGRQIDIERRVGLPAQLRAHRLHILVLFVAAAQILRIAVVLARTGRQAEADGVRHRAAHRRRDVDPVIVAVARLEAPFERVAGLLGHIVDQAADDALAETERLRPLEHLDALEVIEVEQRAGAARQIDAVDEDADRRVGAGALDVRTDAADEQFGIDRALGAELEPRNAVGDFGEILDAGLFERGAAERLDRNRHVLQAFGALARGDDDLVARCGRGGLVRGRLRKGRARRREARHGREKRPAQISSGCHCSLPPQRPDPSSSLGKVPNRHCCVAGCKLAAFIYQHNKLCMPQYSFLIISKIRPASRRRRPRRERWRSRGSCARV